MISLIAASVAFVGTHFLLSHPLRRPIARALGERGFLGIYSLVALATFAWMVIAYRAVGPQPLAHGVGDAGWAVASLVMLIASVLFAGSLVGNPALPNPGGPAPAFGDPRGVFMITRHPMMWAFALWALVHGFLLPTQRDAVITLAILFLALAGAWAQDRKKERLVPHWRDWEGRTAFVPFGLQLAGKARWSLGGVPAWIGGAAIWLAATWVHPLLGGAMPAGIWRWVSLG